MNARLLTGAHLTALRIDGQIPYETVEEHLGWQELNEAWDELVAYGKRQAEATKKAAK